MTESQFSQIVNNEGRNVQVTNNRGALEGLGEKPIDPKSRLPEGKKDEKSMPSGLLNVDFGKALSIDRGGADPEDPTKNAPVAAEDKPVGTV
jgi:hypothetical protein